MKSILLVCPFDPVYPPMNGGMQRCFHIIHQLAKHFELTLIVNQSKEEFELAGKEYPAIIKTHVYSTRDALAKKDLFSLLPHKLEHAFRYRWIKKKLLKPADGNFLKYFPILSQLLKTRKFDVIVLENLASINAVSIIRKYDDNVKIVYNAHNVDSNLARIAWREWGNSEVNYKNTLRTETNFAQTVDAVLACSEHDKNELVGLNKGKLLAEVVPNGVTIPVKMFNEGVKEDSPKYLIFCGILTTRPNSEGLNWFCSEIWPRVRKSFPHLKLLVVGGGELPQEYRQLKDLNTLEFSGRVEDVKPWYNRASLAVVPLLSGSGTRLKVLEALGMGVPVVSTGKGAEGLDFTEGKEILIADTVVEFANSIIMLLNNKEKRLCIGEHGRTLALEKYDWNKIGLNAAHFINGVLFEKSGDINV